MLVATRLRTLMVAIALVAVALALLNEGVISYARRGHVGFHEERARWFASQAADYRGGQPGVREESLRLAAWHSKRADDYRRSRKYDHEAEIKQDGRQIERENSIDRLLVTDLKARIAAGATGPPTPRRMDRRRAPRLNGNPAPIE